jgi:DNA-binding SARP family transcriptional activator
MAEHARVRIADPGWAAPEDGLTIAQSAEPLTVTLLGGFDLRAGRWSLPLPVGSQQLVGFLALQDRPVTRSRVARTLWPDSLAQQSNGSLRSALWRVRNQAPHVVVGDSTSLWLTASAQVDLRDAVALADRLLEPMPPRPEDLGVHAVHLLSLGLLSDWYDDWVTVEADRWEQRRIHALEGLGRALLAEGRYAEAVLAGLAAAEADPLRESGQVIVIEALAAEAKYVGAAHYYNSYRALLMQELGVEPSERLQELLTLAATRQFATKT